MSVLSRNLGLVGAGDLPTRVQRTAWPRPTSSFRPGIIQIKKERLPKCLPASPLTLIGITGFRENFQVKVCWTDKMSSQIVDSF